MNLRMTLVAVWTLAAQALATDYYVDSAVGNNANPGSEAQPWRTITLTVESNSIVCEGDALVLDISASHGIVGILRNALYGGTVGTRLHRQGFAGYLEFHENVIAGQSVGSVALGSLRSGDDVRANLTYDGSLLPFDPTNIWGDPHFVDPGLGDLHLRSTSPCIGAGLQGGDLGALPSGLTRTLDAIWLQPDLLDVRLNGATGTPAVLLCSVDPVMNDLLRACDHQIGISPATFVFGISGTVQFGRWDTLFQVPPEPFTVVFQAVTDVDPVMFTCRLSNTLFVRQ